MNVTTEFFRTLFPHPNEFKLFQFSQIGIKICAQNALLSSLSVLSVFGNMDCPKSKLVRIHNS